MTMENQEKSLVISTLKVYNWQQDDNNDEYAFEFCSLGANETIFHKNIKPVVINRQFIINVSFKITYSPQQNRINLRISRVQNSQSNNFIIAEMIINLDLLKEKQLQYFPFGQNDRVLKIGVGSKIKNSNIYQKPAIDENIINRKFIQERESYLKKINQNIHSVKDSKAEKKDNVFSQKLYGLLQEVKQLRKQRTLKNYSYKLNSSDYQSSQTDSVRFDRVTIQQTPVPREKQLIKSKSQNLLAFSSSGDNVLCNKQTDQQKTYDIPLCFKRRNRLHLKDFSIEPVAVKQKTQISKN